MNHGWAIEKLQEMGFSPDLTMDAQVAAWWSWYDCSNAFYSKPKFYLHGKTMEIERMTMRPARMVCDEFASLLMGDETTISSDDAELDEFIKANLDNFVDENAWLVSRAFALGTACLMPDFSFDGAEWSCKLRGYDARSIIPLAASDRESVAVAVVSSVSVEGMIYDQLRVVYPDYNEQTYVIRTLLYDPEDRERPVEFENFASEVRTGSMLAPYALITPAISNTYDDVSALGVSVFDDAIDALKLLDESFNQMYWHVRLSMPRVFMADSMVARDRATGELDVNTTLDQVLFHSVSSDVGASAPITVYNPDLMVDATERAVDDALSIASLKCGLGPNYFSFTRASGLKTATEVVSDNSTLMRNVRKHEKLIGSQFERAIRGSYAALQKLQGHSITDDAVGMVSVTWDDSTIVDTETQRAAMKDDIARGLCPRWRYLVDYYAMDEQEARAFTGEFGDSSTAGDDLADEVGEL